MPALTAHAKRHITAGLANNAAADEVIEKLDGISQSVAAAHITSSLAIGGALPTNPQAQLSLAPAANASGVTAAQSYFHATILPGGAVTIPTGTAPIVASLNIHEPNITATGTVTVAATVRIADAPSEGSSNYALWVDAGVTRLDGNLDFSSAALDVVMIANTAAALEFYDGTTKVAAFDTRNTIKNTSTLTLTGVPVTVATETAAHINATLNIAAKTITYTGTTQTTSSFGAQLYIAAPTFTDASVATLDAASSVHVAAVAAAGGSLTVTASYMITTGVADAFLTNAGVWTDTSCWEYGKEMVERGIDSAAQAIENVMDAIMPATWKYRSEFETVGADGTVTLQRMNDRGRQRVGIVYDDLPDVLRAPGEERGVAPSILSSFALAALKLLWDENKDLKARLGRLEAAS